MAIVTITARRGLFNYQVKRFNTEYRTPTEADITDAIQAADRIEALEPGQPVTKWDIISDRERAWCDAMLYLIWDGDEQVPGTCGACGEDIGTEGKFARHYILNDIRYQGLGHCPTEDQVRSDG